MDKKVLSSKNESFDWEASKRRVSFNPYRSNLTPTVPVNGHHHIPQNPDPDPDEDSILLNEAQTVLQQINSVNCYPSKKSSGQDHPVHNKSSSFYQQFSSLPTPYAKSSRKSSPSNSYHAFNTNINPEESKQHYIVHTVLRPSSSNSNLSSNSQTKTNFATTHNGGIPSELNSMSSTKLLPNARVPKLAEKISSDNKNPPPPSHYLYSRPQGNHTSYSNMEPFSYTKQPVENSSLDRKNKEVIYAQVVVGKNSKGLSNSNGGKRTVHKTFGNQNNISSEHHMLNGHSTSEHDIMMARNKPLLKNNVTTVLLNNNDDDFSFFSERDKSPSPVSFFRTPFSSALVKEADRQRDSYLPSAKLVNNFQDHPSDYYDDRENVTFANSKRRYYSDNIYSRNTNGNYNAPNHHLYDDKHDLASGSYYGNRNGDSQGFEDDNFGSSKYYGFDYGDKNDEDYMNESNNYYSSYPRRPPPRQKHSNAGKSHSYYKDNISRDKSEFISDHKTSSGSYFRGKKDFNFNEQDEDFREDSPSDFRIEQNQRVSDKYGFFGENASQTLPTNYRSKVKSSPSFATTPNTNNKYRSTYIPEPSYEFENDTDNFRSTTPLRKKAESTSALHALKRTKSNVDKTMKPTMPAQQSIFSTLLRRNKNKSGEQSKVTKNEVKPEKKQKGNFLSSFLDRNFGSHHNSNKQYGKSAGSTLSTHSKNVRSGRDLTRDELDSPAERSKDFKRTSSHHHNNNSATEDQRFYVSYFHFMSSFIALLNKASY